MNFEINIDEEKLQESLILEMVKSTTNNYEVKFELQKAIKEAIKQYIYHNKEEIIQKVVERAAREIVKKGLPILIERGM